MYQMNVHHTTSITDPQHVAVGPAAAAALIAPLLAGGAAVHLLQGHPQAAPSTPPQQRPQLPQQRHCFAAPGACSAAVAAESCRRRMEQNVLRHSAGSSGMALARDFRLASAAHPCPCPCLHRCQLHQDLRLAMSLAVFWLAQQSADCGADRPCHARPVLKWRLRVALTAVSAAALLDAGCIAHQEAVAGLAAGR